MSDDGSCNGEIKMGIETVLRAAILNRLVRKDESYWNILSKTVT